MEHVRLFQRALICILDADVVDGTQAYESCILNVVPKKRIDSAFVAKLEHAERERRLAKSFMLFV